MNNEDLNLPVGAAAAAGAFNPDENKLIDSKTSKPNKEGGLPKTLGLSILDEDAKDVLSK